MNPLTVSLLLGLLSFPGAASADDRNASGITLVVVHVHNGTTNTPARADLPVSLHVFREGRRMQFDGRTGPGGVAVILVPRPMPDALPGYMTGMVPWPMRGVIPPWMHDRGVPRARASVNYGDTVQGGQPFWLFPSDTQPARTSVTIYQPVPPIQLPTWSAIALAALFGLAVGLVAIRRSDGELPH